MNGLIAAIKRIPGQKLITLVSWDSFEPLMMVDVTPDGEFGYEPGHFWIFGAKLAHALLSGSLTVRRFLDETEGGVLPKGEYPKKVIFMAKFEGGEIFPLPPEVVKVCCEAIEPEPGASYGDFSEFLQ